MSNQRMRASVWPALLACAAYAPPRLVAMLHECARVPRQSGRWATATSSVERRCAHRQLGFDGDSQFLDVYYVFEQPLAALEYDDVTTRGVPIVNGVHLKKSTILLVDCADDMRRGLRARYPTLDTSAPAFRALAQIP